MAGMFGHTWVSQYGAEPGGVGGDTWAAALAGITPAQIAEGLRATLYLGRDFPPSAARFRALCFGVPTLAAVRIELRNSDSARSPFLRLVWSLIDDHYAFRQANAEKADRMLRDAYEVATDHVMRGGALPDASAGEIAAPVPPPRTPATDETVRESLARMKDALRIVEQEGLNDSESREMRLEERCGHE